MAKGFMNCVKNRMADMWLPFPDQLFPNIVALAGFLRSMAQVAKLINGTDYTLGQLLRLMAARGALSGAAAWEFSCSQVLAISGSFYMGALIGSFFICTNERIFYGPDNYTPKLSIYQVRERFFNKTGVQIPSDFLAEINSNPEMVGAEIDSTWGSRWEYQFYSSEGEDLAYA